MSIETTGAEADADLDARIAAIVARGPSGAFAVSAIAAAFVVVLYFAFYVFAYLPRGAVR